MVLPPGKLKLLANLLSQSESIIQGEIISGSREENCRWIANVLLTCDQAYFFGGKDEGKRESEKNTPDTFIERHANRPLI